MKSAPDRTKTSPIRKISVISHRERGSRASRGERLTGRTVGEAAAQGRGGARMTCALARRGRRGHPLSGAERLCARSLPPLLPYEMTEIL